MEPRRKKTRFADQKAMSVFWAVNIVLSYKRLSDLADSFSRTRRQSQRSDNGLACSWNYDFYHDNPYAYSNSFIQNFDFFFIAAALIVSMIWQPFTF